MTGKPPNLPDRGSATRRNLPDPRPCFVALTNSFTCGNPESPVKRRCSLHETSAGHGHGPRPIRPRPIKTSPPQLVAPENGTLETPPIRAIREIRGFPVWRFSGTWDLALGCSRCARVFAKRTQFQSINTGLSQNNEPIYMPLTDVQPPSHPAVSSSTPAQTTRVKRLRDFLKRSD
jgi:hypothetical protein